MKRKGLSFGECKKAQKSAQECERKGDGEKHVGTFEGLKVGTLKRKRLTVESGKLKVEIHEKRAREPIRSGSPMPRAIFAMAEPNIHDLR